MNYPVWECRIASCWCTSDKQCHDCEIRDEGYKKWYENAKDKYTEIIRGIILIWIVWFVCGVLFSIYK